MFYGLCIDYKYIFRILDAIPCISIKNILSCCIGKYLTASGLELYTNIIYSGRKFDN